MPPVPQLICQQILLPVPSECLLLTASPATALARATMGSILHLDVPASVLSLLPSLAPTVWSQPRSQRAPVKDRGQILSPFCSRPCSDAPLPSGKKPEGLERLTRPDSIWSPHLSDHITWYFLSPSHCLRAFALAVSPAQNVPAPSNPCSDVTPDSLSLTPCRFLVFPVLLAPPHPPTPTQYVLPSTPNLLLIYFVYSL